jgi:hypothetical protein
MLGYTKRRQGVVSKPVIFHILHGGRPECEQPADFKSIEVMMCQIGSALRPRMSVHPSIALHRRPVRLPPR